MAEFRVEGDRRGGLRGLRVWLWVSGVASLALGVAALLFPFAATLAVELLFGAVLAASGVVQVLRALSTGASGNRLFDLLFGGVALLAGLVLLFFPLQGAVTLTIVLAVFFILGGLFKLFSAWWLRPAWMSRHGFPVIDGWWWFALSGAVSCLLGLVLLLGLPSTATWALGLMVGIDLLVLGAAEIGFARSVGRLERRY